MQSINNARIISKILIVDSCPVEGVGVGMSVSSSIGWSKMKNGLDGGSVIRGSINLTALADFIKDICVI